MDDGQITGGSIRFMQRVKTGDYEHKEVSTELNFMVRDNQDHRDLLDRVSDEAQNTTLRLLGLSKAAARVPAQSRTAVTRKPPTVATHETIVVPVEASALMVEVAPVAPVADPAGIEDDTDPLAPAGASVSGADPSAQVTAPVADASSIEEDDDGLTAARVYTDKDVTDTITKHNARLIEALGAAGTAKIRELLCVYVAPGKHARDIPVEKRGEFIGKLEALK